MEINQETVSHLATLSDLALEEDEAQKFEGDIEEIIKYISQLDELDTADVEPTYQVTGLENVWRVDEIQPQEVSSEELLMLTKDTEKQQIKVPRVL